jgi:NAD(P)-dependent dehydrogenase (short-subunit alcohol dehydrogenase family)
MERGRKAKEEIEDEDPEGNLELRKLDLASLDSVKDFAEEYMANNGELHVLCNNAGVMAVPFEVTEDGFETHFGVNHLGHYALTAHLIQTLVDTDGETRVVTQSSALHKNGEIDFSDLMNEENYDSGQAYADSKLANLLFAFELDRKLEENDLEVESVGCHPGFAATNLQNTEENENSFIRDLGMRLAKKFLAQSAEKGALPMVKAAASGEGGGYIGPGGFMKMRGLPEKQEPGKKALDEEVAEKLWGKSEELTGVKFKF